ncbi:hypothetical protein E2C01_097207 [Portunus trituberculatus]|uniref:Uncharacterized protein n=1 Tax=Portunus trituberculatus TaxID=210409 RepID=A0A5B7K9D4_PORTR|nr:hypothetical protein [Portunus trituberculatus]
MSSEESGRCGAAVMPKEKGRERRAGFKKKLAAAAATYNTATVGPPSSPWWYRDRTTSGHSLASGSEDLSLARVCPAGVLLTPWHHPASRLYPCQPTFSLRPFYSSQAILSSQPPNPPPPFTGDNSGPCSRGGRGKRPSSLN